MATAYRKGVENGTATMFENRPANTAESPTDRTTVASRQPASRHSSGSPPPRSSRSRSTNDPRYLPKRPNLRAQDRRRKDLVEAFLAALGGDGVNDLVMLQVRRCAELQAMCEMARANMLNGEPADMLALVRLEGVAARALRALGVKVEPPPARAARVLELRRQRWEEQRAQEQAKKAREATAPRGTEEPPDDGIA